MIRIMRSLMAAPSLTLALATAAHADVHQHDWHRVTSPDFEMMTDLAPEDGRMLAAKLTRFRLAFEVLLGKQQLPAPSPRIIAFRNGRDFRRVFSLRNLSGITHSSLNQYTLAFGPDGRRGYASRGLTAYHEYTHYLLRHHRQMNYPAWYEEGYANFLSTLHTTEDGIVIGYVSALQRQQMSRARLTVADLIDERLVFDWQRRDLEDIYLKAWQLVHMLHLGHLSGLPPFHARVPEMLAMIDAGETAKVAMETALGVSLSSLERLLKSYGRRKPFPTRTLEVDVESDTPMEVQPMTRADVRRTLGEAAMATGNKGLAAEMFNGVLEENPDDIDALVGFSATTDDPERSKQSARRALALNPNHPGANIRMAEVHVGECAGSTREQCYAILRESAEFYRRAVRNDPDGVEASFGLGVIYLHAGQPGDALGYLRVAYRRAPWAPRINLFLGEAYRLTGDTERAREHLARAMHWHREQRWRDAAALALSLLESTEDSLEAPPDNQ